MFSSKDSHIIVRGEKSSFDRHFKMVKFFMFGVGTLVIVSVIAAIIFTLGFSKHDASPAQACTVNDKQIVSVVNDGDSTTHYRVFTDQCGVMEVSDSLMLQQWDSADIYNQIKVGESYHFTARGYRIPFLSQFPNITKVTPAN